MKGVDLFCGCGGLTRGFEDAKISIVEAYDFWQDAINCYQENFAHEAIVSDISDVKEMSARISKLAPDIIIGGPPCQDFSQAGKRQEGARANLTDCFARIIDSVRPKWFVMENVDRAQHSHAYCKARKILVAAGYGLTEEVLNACNYSVPQNRRRFFCIGLLGAADGFLSDDLRLLKSDTPLTVRQHFQKIRRKITVEHYYRHPRNYSRRGVFSVDEPAPTIRGVNRPVPGGYTGHNGDTQKTEKVHPLTSKERALIQTFPPDFKFFGSKTAIEQMLGNAVPVNLAYAVADAIFSYEQMSADHKSGRGRKAAQNSICGVKRDAFMRWLKKDKTMAEKTAKDYWSWLSKACICVRLSELPDDEAEALFRIGRAAKNQSKINVSRMKKSVRLYREFRQRTSPAKKPRLL